MYIKVYYYLCFYRSVGNSENIYLKKAIRRRFSYAPLEGSFYFVNMKEEIWKPIPKYENLYKVSSFGRVKSLRKDKILKPILLSNGYYKVSLGIYHKPKIHQLVAICFLNHIPDKYNLIVDHINGDPLDNRVENLQLITQRENITKANKTNKTSIYTGVHWHKPRNKWRACISINGKNLYLGCFKNELDAHLSYQKKLHEIQSKFI